MSELFTKVLLGGEAYKLRMTPEYRWRILTLENPAWANDFEARGYLAVACQIWAMFDPEDKKAAAKFKSPKDVLSLIDGENGEAVVAAMNECFDLAKPRADSKNGNGSTQSPSPASS